MLSFLAAALVGFGEGFVSTLMAPWAAVVLGGGGRELGLLMSVQAIGGMAAGLLLAGFASRLSAVKLLGWGGLLSGLMLLLIFNVPLIFPRCGLRSFSRPSRACPSPPGARPRCCCCKPSPGPDVRGRVFGAYFACFGGAQFVGMAASGVLGDAVGVLVINVDAVTYLLAGTVVFGFLARAGSPRASAS